MLKEAKRVCGTSDMEFDDEIASLIEAGAMDLKHFAGVKVDGILFSRQENAQGEIVVTDLCTLEDPLIKRAIFTYCKMNFRNPPDYDKLLAAYDMQKAQLQSASGYGLPDERSEENDD